MTRKWADYCGIAFYIIVYVRDVEETDFDWRYEHKANYIYRDEERNIWNYAFTYNDKVYTVKVIGGNFTKKEIYDRVKFIIKKNEDKKEVFLTYCRRLDCRDFDYYEEREKEICAWYEGWHQDD